MQQLITNSEISLQLHTFFFLLPSSCTFKSDGLLCSLSTLDWSSEKMARESSLEIFQSLRSRGLCLIFPDHTVHEESFFICYLSLYCQKSTKNGLLPASIHICGMWAQFKVCLELLITQWLQISILHFLIPHFLENVFEDAQRKENEIREKAEREKGTKKTKTNGQREWPGRIMYWKGT